MAEDTLIRVVEEREALRAEVARLRAELAKEQRLTRFSSTETRNALAEEMNAHAKTQAELERRTAWSNAEIARLREELEEALHRGDQHIASLSEALAAHEAAKADHENALANCMHVLRERDEARARVAELERIAQIEAQLKELAMACNKTLAAALDQARGFTERALAYLSDEEDLESTPLHAIGHARTELRGLLAAIPATTTSAATGAEPEDTCCVCGDPCTSSICLGCENSGAGT